ncbi:amino acid adenylation domain-containing protein [Streptomyces sp. NPDC050560]|uniref:amino acid adenylation domain-containing protein n=1 Tax=Streptomyces sp. NPDC050560 TaxID=3365630 RepID=UPI0037B160FE
MEETRFGQARGRAFTATVDRGDIDTAAFARALADVTAAPEPAPPEIGIVECPDVAGPFEGYARRRACALLDGMPGGGPGSRLLLLSEHGMLRAVLAAGTDDAFDAGSTAALLRAALGRHDELRGGAAPEREDGSGCARAPRGAVPAGAPARLAAAWSVRLGVRLGGVPGRPGPPGDRPGPQDHEAPGGRLPVRLSPDTAAAVRDRSRSLDVSPYAFLLAAFALTLRRLTGVRALPVEVPSVDAPCAEGVQVVDYGNAVPVRIAPDDDQTPDAYVRRVHEALTRGLHRSGPRHPLLRPSCAGERRPGGTGPRSVLVDEAGTARCAVGLRLYHGDGSLAGFLEHDRGLWSPGEAQGFARGFEAAAMDLVRATSEGGAARTLVDIRCLSARDRMILDRVNGAVREFPPSSLDELFRATARRRPGTVAVRDAESALTYSELAAAAAEQAALLRAAGVRQGDTVLVGVPRSVAEAVAVLGVLWAGAAYVGVDLSEPEAHTAKIVAKASPAAAVVAGERSGRLARCGIPTVSPWQPGRSSGAPGAPPPPPDPDRLAYVAFTSGSSGDPKGVAIPHRAVIRLVHGADYLPLGPGERMLRLSPLPFDASTLELWGSMLTGATLEVCPQDRLSPNEIGAFLGERHITVAWLTAGLFRLVQEFAGGSLGTLRHLMTGGDVVPHEHVRRALVDHPGLVVSNGYGPTENTTFTTVHQVRDPAAVDGPVPIGTPVPGTRVYVLDERARLLMPGAVGELYIGGEGLAAGYLKDAEETARSFGFLSPDVPERLYRTGDLVRIDQDGRIHFLGRADDQVKVRGHRVRLHVISEALTAVDGVEESVVTVTEGDSGDKRLMAAVRLTPGAGVSPAELRSRLCGLLPSYLVPALWAVVDRLPVTANGKVDRRLLAAAARPAGAFARHRVAGGARSGREG